MTAPTAAQVVRARRKARFAEGWRIFRADRAGLVGLVLLAAIVLLALLAPLLTDSGGLDVTRATGAALQAPSAENPLGTDESGRSVLLLTWWVPRSWGASYADRVTILFCGSNKSLATGLPMATVLFPPHVIGLIVLPIILYHPLQITVCSFLAGRLGRDGRVPALQG